MKAFMSVPGMRAVCCITPSRDGQHAEAEARMLLGKTEPDPSWLWNAIAAGEASVTPLCAQPESIRARLAEALAAFVDDGQARS